MCLFQHKLHEVARNLHFYHDPVSDSLLSFKKHDDHTLDNPRHLVVSTGIADFGNMFII